MGIVSRIVGYFHPLQRKLPLLIAALLCAVVGTFGWLVQAELERVVASGAADRLTVASNRLAGLLAESAALLRAEGHRVATDPTVIAALEHPRNATTTGAAALVLSRQAPAPVQRASRALWSRACELRLANGPLAAIPELSPCLAGNATVDSPAAVRVRTGVQPLVARGDTVLYVIVEPVIRAVSDTIGFMVQVRNLAGGSSGQAIGGLIGKGATLVFGNAQGAVVWTDLVKRIAVPAGSGQRGGVITHLAPDGSGARRRGRRARHAVAGVGARAGRRPRPRPR